jgi:hypothetical protein
MTARGLIIRNDVQCSREHVPLIVSTELFASDAKRRTRHATSDQINVSKRIRLEVPNVLLEHVPMRAIQSECDAVLGFILHDTDMMESGTFQA